MLGAADAVRIRQQYNMEPKASVLRDDDQCSLTIDQIG